jgi:exonuclease III
MDHQNRTSNRQWKILCWNVRGINATNKWTALRSEISETIYDILCLQETKQTHFD